MINDSTNSVLNNLCSILPAYELKYPCETGLRESLNVLDGYISGRINVKAVYAYRKTAYAIADYDVSGCVYRH